jgi:hypothetical protein
MTPNTSTTYTKLESSLRGHQLHENMKLVLKHFYWNLNAKMALSTAYFKLRKKFQGLS